MDTLKQAVTMGSLGGGPDRNSGWNGNDEQRSGSRGLDLIVRPTQRGARLGGLRRVRLRLGSKSTISKRSGAKLLGRIKLACFFRDASHNSKRVLTKVS